MTRVFLDTSAVLALLVPTDVYHQEAKHIFAQLRSEEAVLLTTSYVILETYALLGRRLGPAAVRAFREDFVPLLDVIWVDPDLHERGLDLLLDRSIRDLSLVDTVSFLVAKEKGIKEAFAFDGHFDTEGLKRPG